MRIAVLLLFALLSAGLAWSGQVPSRQQTGAPRNGSVRLTGPDCSGVERWPTSMAFVHLKNAGNTDNDRLDFTKTRTKRLASEAIGRSRYRQVHHVTFTETSGKRIELITVNEATEEECSGSGVDVYVVAQHLGPN